jgi:peptide/nickel transport system substrate-binding protein
VPSPSSSPGSLVVRIGQLQTVDNLNPFIGIQGIDYEIWHLNYDFLVGFDAKTLAPRPELATSWSVSPDGKTWTFQTRQNVKWQDGVPFTAADVAFTFNYIVKNNLSNLAVYTDGITGAKATGPNTVQIYTKAPKANMLRMVVPILPQHIWSKVSGKAASTSFANKPPIIGTGPFQVVDWKPGQYVHLKANPNYWGGAPHISDLYILTYTNADTMVSDLKLGPSTPLSTCPSPSFAGSRRPPASRPTRPPRGSSPSSPSTATRAPTRRATRCCATRSSARP